MILFFFFFLLSLFVTLYIFLHLTAMYSSTFGKGGWVGAVCTFWHECPLEVLACESLHVCTVSGAVNTQGFVCKFVYALYINFHSFHSYIYIYNEHLLSVSRRALSASQWQL